MNKVKKMDNNLSMLETKVYRSILIVMNLKAYYKGVKFVLSYSFLWCKNVLDRLDGISVNHIYMVHNIDVQISKGKPTP